MPKTKRAGLRAQILVPAGFLGLLWWAPPPSPVTVLPALPSPCVHPPAGLPWGRWALLGIQHGAVSQVLPHRRVSRLSSQPQSFPRCFGERQRAGTSARGEGAGDQQPSWCYGNSLSPGC